MSSQPDKHDSFRDSVSTIDEKGKRVWINPLKPKGRFYNLRSLVSYACLIILFGVPWIKVDGHPFMMLNVLERKFILFGVIFWPQDFFLFGLAMLTFMLFIVVFTVIYGRLWCGWTCPQTIFMEMVFRKIEYLIEGDSVYQKALNKMPWNAEKIRKKGLKYAVFALISFIISNTFLAYIIGTDELLKIIREPLYMHVGGFVSIWIFTGVFFFVFAYLREQACIVVCPYGRLQGVLLDRNSIVVAYDYLRGEPREKYKKDHTSGMGDCVDCGLCVKVCPTGIDIRNGTQLECVNCTACIDACDHMMDQVKRPRGLIRYASEKQIKDKIPFKITGRIVGYTIVLAVLLVVLSFSLASRSEVETTVLRTPGMMFQEQPMNRLSNLYNYKIINKTYRELPVTFKLMNVFGTIKYIGDSNITVNKESVKEGEFFIILDKKNIIQRKTKIKIGVYSNGKKMETLKTNFIGKSN